MQIESIFEDDILKVIASGIFSLEGSKRTFSQMLEQVGKYGARKILFDGLLIEGEPTSMDRFRYGEFVAHETSKFSLSTKFTPRFAYVMLPPVADPGKFGENVAVNRGMHVKTFGSVEAALRWLNSENMEMQ